MKDVAVQKGQTLFTNFIVIKLAANFHSHDVL